MSFRMLHSFRLEERAAGLLVNPLTPVKLVVIPLRKELLYHGIDLVLVGKLVAGILKEILGLAQGKPESENEQDGCVLFGPVVRLPVVQDFREGLFGDAPVLVNVRIILVRETPEVFLPVPVKALTECL